MPSYYEYFTSFTEETESDDETPRVKLVVNEDYYLREHLMPIISKKLTHANINRILDFTAKFIDDNTDAFFQPGPIKNITFDTKETRVFYDMFGLTEESLFSIYTEAVKLTYVTNNADKIPGYIHVKISPHILLFTAITALAIDRKDEDLLDCCAHLVAFTFYPILFRKYWPHGPVEEVMLYTVEHLTPKHKLKQVGHLLGWLRHHGTQSITNYRTRLTEGMANSIYTDFVNRVRSQINSAFRNLQHSYMKNHEENATQHSTKSKSDEGILIMGDTDNSRIASITERTLEQFVSGGVNEVEARRIANAAGVSPNKLSSYVQTILNTKENKLYRFIEDVIILYGKSNPSDDSIGSGSFLSFGLSLYTSIGISKDPMRVEIRKIVDYWSNDLLELPKEFPSRAASVISYRKAIFNYFIRMIQLYN